MLDKAAQIQEQDKDALREMLTGIRKDNAMGMEINAELAKQNAQLQNASEAMDRMDSHMALATKQLRNIGKRLATDKIILGIVLVIVLCVVFLIVFFASNPLMAAAVLF